MKVTVQGETPFMSRSDSMMIGISNEDMILAFSADGDNFTQISDKVIPAGENCIVIGCPDEAYFKLVGNNSEVKVIL